MKRIVRTGVFVGATAAVIISGTLVSYASWIAPTSAATVKAKAGSVPQGVTPSAAIQSGKAVVSWSAQEIIPGVRMTSYVVAAHDTDAAPRPDVAHTVTASGAPTESATFTAAELAGGKWKFAIIPRFRTWLGTEGKLSNPKLVFAGAAPATVLAAAVTAVAANGTTPPTAPPIAPVPTPPTQGPTTTVDATPPSPTVTTEAPEVDPTTSVPAQTPEKTESPKTDPSPTESPAAAEPSPSTSASE